MWCVNRSWCWSCRWTPSCGSAVAEAHGNRGAFCWVSEPTIQNTGLFVIWCKKSFPEQHNDLRRCSHAILTTSDLWRRRADYRIVWVWSSWSSHTAGYTFRWEPAWVTHTRGGSGDYLGYGRWWNFQTFVRSYRSRRTASRSEVRKAHIACLHCILIGRLKLGLK